MNDLFRERFQGHEAPVDPGTWEAIQGKLAAATAVAGTDPVSELFRDRFQGHEVQVVPSVWQGISSQLGHTAAVGTTASSGFFGWAAAGVAALALATGGYFLLRNDTPTADPAAPVAEVRTPQAAVPAEGPAVTPVVVPARPTTVQEEASAQSVPSSTTAPVRTSVPPAPVSATVPEHTPAPAVEQIDLGGPSSDLPTPTLEQMALVEEIINQKIVENTIVVKKEDSVLKARGRNDAALVQEPELFPEPVQKPSLPELYLPNTFTPNGDGTNDDYQVGGTEAYRQVIIRITSLRTGQVVFSSNTNEPWTGAGQEDGYYVVAVEAHTDDNRTATGGKVVWLNRNPMN